MDESTTWVSKILNGSDLFWSRVRVTTSPTTAPVFEQTKLHTSRFEANSDGTVELFGTARYRDTLSVSGNAFGESGGVTNFTVNVGSGGIPTGWPQQNKNSLLGKTIRINDDGTVPADNPFIGSNDANDKIFTWGHRNRQGLTLDTDTGAIYLHEHGPRGGDEVNRLEPGKNYGWPAITYGINYSGAYVSPFTQHPTMEQPLKYWVPSIAPAGLAYYNGDVFPAWRGDLFVGALVNQDVRRLDMEDGKVVGEEILFTEIGERIRDVRVGPDGFIYILTDSSNGKIVRVIPADS